MGPDESVFPDRNGHVPRRVCVGRRRIGLGGIRVEREMNPSVGPLHELIRLNTRLFLNALDGVDEERAKRRPSDETNSILFTVCHLLDARYFLARLLGVEAECPYQALFDAARTIDDLKDYPPLDELKSTWTEVSALVDEGMSRVDAQILDGRAPIEFPVEDGTVLGGVAFLVQHESYHLGQLGFLRKYQGLGPMNYSP